MILVSKILGTSGDGYWSDVVKEVPVTGLELVQYEEDQEYGELRVYFDTQIWDVNSDGLIYTDSKFAQGLKDLLASMKLGTDVGYSEQGMQGDNYVSLDAGSEFVQSFKAIKA